MENPQDQQLLFQDHIVNELISILQSDSSTPFKCNSIINHQHSFWIYYELISTITFNNNIFNRNPTPHLVFQCSELFENANQEFIDYLFDHQEGMNEELAKQSLFRNLITLIEQDTIVETMCGYFYKVMNSIIKKKRGEDVWNYLENDKRLISSFLKHVDQPHICRILTELIIFGLQSTNILDYSFLARQIAERLFSIMINKSYQTIIVDNICEIFIDILQTKQEKQELDISQIQFISPLQFFCIAKQSNSEGPYTLLNLLSFQYKNDKLLEWDLFNNILPLISQEFQYTNDQQSNKLFSRKNMKLLTFTLTLIESNNKQINSKLLDHGLVNVLINTIYEFPFHNQLHFTAFIIFEKLIESDQMDQQMIGLLLNFIIIQLSQAKNILGYKGFLSKLANYLINKQNNPVIMQAMKNNEHWEIFSQSTLKNINSIEQNFYFNFNPRQPIGQVIQQDVSNQEIQIQQENSTLGHQYQDQQENIKQQE